MSETPDGVDGMDPNLHETLGRFFGAHNARSTHTKELVEMFVPDDPWRKLVKPRNHLLVGPRGAGKTHLLRMLAPKSLAAWSHSDAEQTRSIVDYPAAVILSDRHWHAQLRALSGMVDSELAVRLEHSAMTIAVMKALLECATQRLHGNHLPLPAEIGKDSELWRSIAKVWRLPPAGSLRMLKDHVSLEASELHNRVSRLGGSSDHSRLHELAIFGTDPHLVAEAFVERVNDFSDEPERRWALLFDEVELASVSLRHYIEHLLRGASQQLLIKVSLSPYTEAATMINTPMGGMAGHDFEPISLTYPDKASAREFTLALMQRDLSRRNIDLPVEELLGESAFDEAEGSEYGGVDTYRALAGRDPSFAEYLRNKEIDLDNLDALSREDRAAWLRKPRGAISIREYYGFNKGGGRRPQQLPLPYTGTTSVCAVLEGNARWILGFTERLVSDHSADKPIPKEIQARTIRRAARSYCNFLAMLPHPGSNPAAQPRPVELAERIGEFFTAQTVDEPFRAEPPTTFRVPDNTTEETQAALKILLHAGALVHVPDSEDQVAVGPLLGQRFRLAYLLAPIHPFPARVSKAVSLETILTGAISHQMHLDQREEDPS